MSLKKLRHVQERIDTLRKKAADLECSGLPSKRSDQNCSIEQIEDLMDLLTENAKFYTQEIIKEDSTQHRSQDLEAVCLPLICTVTGVDRSHRGWASLPFEVDTNLVPCPQFKEEYMNATKAFHMVSHSGYRIIIDLFLSNIVLLPEFNHSLRIFPGIGMSIESNIPENPRICGITDYAVGLVSSDNIRRDIPDDLGLIVMEAKNGSFECDDRCSCIAHIAALHKIRKDAGKTNCSVWGVVSMATKWMYMKLDEDGKLWESDSFWLDLEHYKQEQVFFVYRSLHYIVKSCYNSCKTTPA